MGGVSLRERSDGTRLDFLEVSLQVPHDDTERLRGLGIRMFEDERSARITTDDDSRVERHPAQERQPELLRGVLAGAATEVLCSPAGPQLGSIPASVASTCAAWTPISIGMSGPVTSAWTMPAEPSSASTTARFAATELFPTPPFPDITMILCLMRDMRCAIFMRSRIAAMMCGGI